jgi:hypothetical protein
MTLVCFYAFTQTIDNVIIVANYIGVSVGNKVQFYHHTEENKWNREASLDFSVPTGSGLVFSAGNGIGIYINNVVQFYEFSVDTGWQRNTDFDFNLNIPKFNLSTLKITDIFMYKGYICIVRGSLLNGNIEFVAEIFEYSKNSGWQESSFRPLIFNGIYRNIIAFDEFIGVHKDNKIEFYNYNTHPSNLRWLPLPNSFSFTLPNDCKYVFYADNGVIGILFNNDRISFYGFTNRNWQIIPNTDFIKQ